MGAGTWTALGTLEGQVQEVAGGEWGGGLLFLCKTSPRVGLLLGESAVVVNGDLVDEAAL